MTKCVVRDCPNPRAVRKTGFCHPHHDRYRKTGSPVVIYFPVAPFRAWVAQVTQRDPNEPNWRLHKRQEIDNPEENRANGYVQDEIAADIGVTQRTLCRWFKEGQITLANADLICTRLNLNHTALWPDFYTKTWESENDDEFESVA